MAVALLWLVVVCHLNYSLDRLAADALGVVWADEDVVEHGVVEELPGIVWTGGVELSGSGQQAENDVEPGCDEVDVGAESVESLLGQGELCRDVSLFLLEVVEADSFGEVGVEESLFGAGQSGDFAVGGFQFCPAPVTLPGEFAVYGCLGALDTFWAECLALPEFEDGIFDSCGWQVGQVAVGALLGPSEAKEVFVHTASAPVVAVAQP